MAGTWPGARSQMPEGVTSANLPHLARVDTEAVILVVDHRVIDVDAVRGANVKTVGVVADLFTVAIVPVRVVDDNVV